VMRDQIYDVSDSVVEKFCFDEKVVAVFQDMIRRSVPGYALIVSLIGVIAEKYLQKSTRFYDLGSSLGAVSLAVNAVACSRSCEVIAIDSSAAMIHQAQQNFAHIDSASNIQLIHADVCETKLAKASMVVLNFTLQFIPVENRQSLLKRIHDGLLPGGVLVLSEKIVGETAWQQECWYELHHDFKRANGYSELEVSKKRDALEGVMITEKMVTHQQRLMDVGFTRVEVVFQSLNFVTMLVFK